MHACALGVTKLKERRTTKKEPQLRKRLKYRKKCKDAWTREYLRGLRECHTLAHKETPCRVQRGDVRIIKDESKNRNKWTLGILEELITGRDGIVRGVKLRAGKKYLERAVQQLYSLELFCDRPQLQEPPRAPVLNPGAPVYTPRRDAAVAAGLRVQEIAQHEQNQ